MQYIRWVEEEKVVWKELNREKTSFCISYILKISYREIFEERGNAGLGLDVTIPPVLDVCVMLGIIVPFL